MEFSRMEYLQSLATDYGVSEKTVFLMADLLGEGRTMTGSPPYWRN